MLSELGNFELSLNWESLYIVAQVWDLRELFSRFNLKCAKFNVDWGSPTSPL